MYDALKRQLTEIIEAGDAKRVESFVLDHFTEFPEDLQSKILATYYVDAVGKTDADEAIRDLQREGLALMEQLEALKSELGKGST